MKSSRPEFNRMMEQVRAGEIGTVLVYSFSRFARSTKHLIEALEEFNRLGVAFISRTEQIDTSTPIGKAMFTIISAMAQLERDLTAERVKNGLKNAVAKGKTLGRPKTAGKKAATVRALRVDGALPEAIAEQLASFARERLPDAQRGVEPGNDRRPLERDRAWAVRGSR
jgi:DNA invertase Pin-like site-specific DNA recombinase